MPIDSELIYCHFNRDEMKLTESLLGKRNRWFLDTAGDTAYYHGSYQKKEQRMNIGKRIHQI